ncbi:hypothetical protein M0805_009050 [Coniferiporia weirii]|nr:hypothetical protein M0805_009050 [Coniferiporia weirii]
MDTGALAVTALGSTVGLALFTCIGLHQRTQRTSSPSFPTSLNYEQVTLALEALWDNALSQSVRRRLSEAATRLLAARTRFVQRHLEQVLFIQTKLERVDAAIARWRRKYRRVRRRAGAECTRRNLRKLLRIVKVWEPLPYDLVFALHPRERVRECVARPGTVGVCLRFRKGTLEQRLHRKDPWGLEGRVLSMMDNFPLEDDGSLRLDLVRKRFSIEELEFLVPGRYDAFYAADEERISALALHNLTQQFGYVNVVEREDVYCQTRRRFRQWLRGSLFYYVVRWICYAVFVASALALDVYATRRAWVAFPQLEEHRGWFVLLGVCAFAFGYKCYIRFMRNRYETHGSEWHVLPQRPARGFLWEGGWAEMFL